MKSMVWHVSVLLVTGVVVDVHSQTSQRATSQGSSGGNLRCSFHSRVPNRSNRVLCSGKNRTCRSSRRSQVLAIYSISKSPGTLR